MSALLDRYLAERPQGQEVQGLPLRLGQPRQRLVSDRLDHFLATPERPVPRRREPQLMPAPVRWIQLPHQHPGLLEAVDDADHLASVDLDRVGHLLLGSAGLLVHAGEHLMSPQAEAFGG